MEIFCLKCNSDLYFLLSPVCAVCSSKINFNLNSPSDSSISSLNLQLGEDSNSDKSMENVLEKTMRDLEEVGVEINTYRTQSQRNSMSYEPCTDDPPQKRTTLKLQDLLQETKSEKYTSLEAKLLEICSPLVNKTTTTTRFPKLNEPGEESTIKNVVKDDQKIACSLPEFKSVLSHRTDDSNFLTDRLHKRTDLKLKDSLEEKLVEVNKTEKILDILRGPIICPITQCKKLIFASQLSEHIYYTHTYVPVEILKPGHQKEIYLKIEDQQPLGINKCVMLYLVKGKISDFSTRFSEYLPFALMTTSIGIGQLLSEDWDVEDDEPKMLLIWLIGIFPENWNICFDLTSHSLNGLNVKKSGKLYHAKMDQNFKTIYDSGICLILTEDDLKNLTDNGENVLKLQVKIY